MKLRRTPIVEEVIEEFVEAVARGDLEAAAGWAQVAFYRRDEGDEVR